MTNRELLAICMSAIHGGNQGCSDDEGIAISLKTAEKIIHVAGQRALEQATEEHQEHSSMRAVEDLSARDQSTLAALGRLATAMGIPDPERRERAVKLVTHHEENPTSA